MISAGLEQEVRELLSEGYREDLVSMQGIGYKEMIQYIKNVLSLEEVVDLIKKNTRHFAKRQLTWFRREKEVTMINVNEFNYDKEKILENIIMILQKRNIIKDNNNE